MDAAPQTSTPPKRPSRAAYFRERRARLKAEAALGISPARGSAERRSADAAETVEWIEANLRVPTGPLAGKPFRVPAWQREWLQGALQPGVQEAGMSVGRKNGKSGFIAAVFLAHLVGPRNLPDWRGVVASLTGPVAKELRDAVELTAHASGLGPQLQLYRSPAPGRILGRRGSRLDFLAADKASGHALGADLALIDEAGLLPERRRELWNALYSCISGREGRFWCISIQGDGPMFEEMAAREGSKGVYFRKWFAPPECELDDEAAWAAANPGLADGIKSIAYMRATAARAVEAPGNEMAFRAYDLNQPVDPEREVIVGLDAYRKCLTPDAPELEGDVVVGIDLGSSDSMTCAVALNPETGAILVRGAFADTPPLSSRARRDRMGSLYDRMVREGELTLYGGRTTPVVDFLRDFFLAVGERATILALGLDRHRRAEATDAFEKAGIPPRRVYWRGTGAAAFADGSHDVRAFQRRVLDGRLALSGSTMLEAAIASSVLRYDGAGNPALDKAGNHARIDALSAAVIAAGLAELVKPAPLLRSHIV